MTPAVITQDIANLINTLGMVDADSGVTTTLNGATVCNLVPADSNGGLFPQPLDFDESLANLERCQGPWTAS